MITGDAWGGELGRLRHWWMETRDMISNYASYEVDGQWTLIQHKPGTFDEG